MIVGQYMVSVDFLPKGEPIARWGGNYVCQAASPQCGVCQGTEYRSICFSSDTSLPELIVRDIAGVGVRSVPGILIVAFTFFFQRKNRQ